MGKQEFIMAKLMDHEIVAKPSTRVYKALKDTMAEIYQQLLRIRTGGELDASMEETVGLLAKFFDGLAPAANTISNIDREYESVWDLERY